MNQDYKCPICGGELKSEVGNVMHPGDPAFGITLFCPSNACPAQEVMGHGDKERDAYAVIVAKYKADPKAIQNALPHSETPGGSEIKCLDCAAGYSYSPFSDSPTYHESFV